MNKYHNAIIAYLETKDVTLLTHKFDCMVEIQHGDGSHFFLHNAFVKEKLFDGVKFLLVWTEHCGYYYFFIEDLEHWIKYKQI
jgi:hypothetical protein